MGRQFCTSFLVVFAGHRQQNREAGERKGVEDGVQDENSVKDLVGPRAHESSRREGAISPGGHSGAFDLPAQARRETVSRLSELGQDWICDRRRYD